MKDPDFFFVCLFWGGGFITCVTFEGLKAYTCNHSFSSR